VTGAMLAVATFALLTVGISYAAFRSSRLERLVEGRAVIIVKDGTPLEQILAIERSTVDEVKEAAREQGIADPAIVRLGVLGSDGKFSFLRRDDGRSPSQQERAENQ
jgi:uncharacterized membrane protein YcaP (DUF421 family)